ncbi:MAG: hypothetical protein ACRYFX_03875 [Janthinobacterium lividum]
MKRPSNLPLFGILLALLAGTWATASYYRQQNRLYVQLQQLGNVLTTENDEATQQADGTLSVIKQVVEKNHNQPTDMAILRRAEDVQSSIANLITTLRAYADELRHTTSNPAAPALLLYPAATGQLLSPARQQALRQQVAALADTLRRLEPAGVALVAAPAFGSDLPVVEALADLSQLESDLLAHQARALQHLAESVRSSTLVANKLLAAASAESNVLAPGDTYRAELLLVNHFGADLRMHMACNGRPVPVGPDGVGLVRFRAPRQPGPATWTGTVRFTENGRDTTYQVTVLYRVARR